jgi:hypothetical protein
MATFLLTLPAAAKTGKKKTRSGHAVRVLKAIGTVLSVRDQAPSAPFPASGGQQQTQARERPELNLIEANVALPSRGVKRGECKMSKKCHLLTRRAMTYQPRT